MVVMEMRWPGVTPAQYDEVKRVVDWPSNPSPNGYVHIAWFEDGALRCYDVWESEQSFNDFAQNRLAPAFQQLQIEGQPEVSFHPAHDIFVLNRAAAGV